MNVTKPVPVDAGVSRLELSSLTEDTATVKQHEKYLQIESDVNAILVDNPNDDGDANDDKKDIG